MTPSNGAETFSVEIVIKNETIKYIVTPDFYTPIYYRKPHVWRTIIFDNTNAIFAFILI